MLDQAQQYVLHLASGIGNDAAERIQETAGFPAGQTQVLLMRECGIGRLGVTELKIFYRIGIIEEICQSFADRILACKRVENLKLIAAGQNFEPLWARLQ
ncbi:hypothetical protein GCM10022278_17200 [Allohahella marinimesophila]|uniref:Uncharacterized protein n=1 Tax=Allohahella marinimesophila TaxID=1054972 RepID=A0ABP7P4F6_9GAMM